MEGGYRSCQVERSQPAPGREPSPGQPGEQTRKLQSFQGSRVDERYGGDTHLTLGKEQTGSRMQLELHRYQVTQRVSGNGMPGPLRGGAAWRPADTLSLKGPAAETLQVPPPTVLCLGLAVTASRSDAGRWAALEHQVLPGGPAAVTSFPGAFLGPVL